MNAHTPFDAKQDWTNPYCQNSSNDPMVDALLGNAYHVVRTVYCNLGNLKLIYDFLNQYGMVLGVQSEAELKALTTKATFARIYDKSPAGDRRVTDYLYVEGDRTGILPDDATSTGSWVKVATSGSSGGGESSSDGGYIPWIYNSGSANGGETTIRIPDETAGAPFMIVNGDWQTEGYDFEYDPVAFEVRFSTPLEPGDFVVVMRTGVPATPDNPNVSDWVTINWLYNQGAAVGGEQVIDIPYTFQSVPAVYKNGLRFYKSLPSDSYTIDSDNNRIILTEPLATNDRLIVQLGGEARVLEVVDHTLQEVARSTNVKDSEVILSTNTSQVLNGKTIIFDVLTQHTYRLPSLPSNTYIKSVENGKLTYTPGNVVVDLIPLDAELTQNIINQIHTELSAPTGGSLINYKLPHSSSVIQPLLGHLGLHVSVRDFGAVGDGVADEKVAFMAAFDYMKSVGGGTLLVPPGDYFFGDYSSSDFVMDIQDTHNVTVIGYGATFSVRSTQIATPFLFALRGCSNWKFMGCSFIDLGFDPSSWLTHQRWGMAAICIRPTEGYNSGLVVQDCQARNLTYFVLSDQTTAEGNLRSFGDIDIRNCYVENAYYGVNLLYFGGTTRVDMDCKDVRRGFISYGQRNTDIHINLYTSAGFFGSNAFISLACEGYTHLRKGAALGSQCLVDNIRIRLNVTGYEAHGSYVCGYHQQDADSLGVISNIDASVQIDYLSTAGKEPGVGNTNVFALRHETPTGVIQSTPRRFHNFKMDCQIAGTITGKVIAFESVNNNDMHVLEMSKQMMRYASDIDLARWVVAAIWNCAVKVQLTGFSIAFNPIGTTVAGAATGLTLDGYIIKDGKTVTVNGRIRYTSHTGTGQLRLDNVPFAAASSVNLSLLLCPVISGSRPAGTLYGSVAGAAGKQVVMSAEAASGWTVYNVPPGNTEILFQGSYQSVQ